MVTKKQDAATIVGDEWAEKLEAYERKLKRKEKYKSAAEPELILKSRVYNEVLALVEKENLRQSFFSKAHKSGSRIKPLSSQIVYGPGTLDQKIDAIAPLIKAFYEDVRDVYWDDQVADFFLWKVKKFREELVEGHIVQQVESTLKEIEVAKAMVNDLRMLKALGRRVRVGYLRSF